MRQAAVGGIFWVAVGQYSSQAVSFVTPFVLAGLLRPYDYGVFGLAFMVVALLGLVKGLGFGPALVYEQEDIQAAADTAFWILLAVGALLSAAAFFAAPLAAAFFDTPDMVAIIRVLGLSFILFALRAVHESLLIKEMHFRAMAGPSVISVIGQSVVSIALAAWGFGAWSLLWGVMTNYVLLVLMFWLVSPYRPSLRFDRRLARRLIRFGLFGLMSDLFLFLGRSAPSAAIGRLLGAAPTGLYGFAFTMGSVSESRVGMIVYRVTQPVFARLQRDLKEVKRTYLLAVRYLALAVIPLSMGALFLLPLLLQALYGDKWLGSIPPLRVLALFGLVMGLAAPNGALLYGIGQPRVFFLSNLLVAAIILPLVYFIARSWGITGVAALVTIANGAGVLVASRWIFSHLGIGIVEYLGQLRAPFIAMAAALAVFYVLRIEAAEGATQSITVVLGLILAWGLSYGLVLLALNAELRSFVLSVLRHPRRMLANAMLVVTRAS